MIEQYRGVTGYLDRLAHVASEVFLVVDDFHRAPTEHIGRTHYQRETDLVGGLERIVHGKSDMVRRLQQTEVVDHLLKTLAILGQVNRIRRGTNNRYPCGLKRTRQVERRLPAKLNDYTFGFFQVNDLEYVLVGQRLEVQSVRRIVVGGDGFRVAVDHDGFVTVFAHRQRGVYAAIIEFDALPDSIGTAAEHDDLVTIAGFGLAFLVVTRIQVGGARREFGGAGVDALVNGPYTERTPVFADADLVATEQVRDAIVRKTLALQIAHLVRVDRVEPASGQAGFELDQFFDLHQEPRIDGGMIENLFEAVARTKSIGDIPDPLCTRQTQLLAVQVFEILRIHILVDDLVEPVHAGFESAQGFLKGLLEIASDRHNLANRLHLCRQSIIGLREFLEGKPRNLGHDIVDARFERGRGCAAGDIVLELVQRIAYRQLGRDLGNRESGGLGGERRRTRYPRVHLDNNQFAVFRVHRELHVGTARLDADLAQHRERRVTHDLVLLVGQRLCGCDGNRITGMHTHRIEIFDRADDDAVVVLVAHDLHFVFFPAEYRGFNQYFSGRRQVETAADDVVEFLAVIGNASPAAAHGERRPDDNRKTDLRLALPGFLDAVRDK